MCLQLEAANIHRLDWLDPPPEAALAAAEQLLDRLNARGNDAAKLARMPLHPRLARLVLDGGEPGCRVAALLSSGQRVNSPDLTRALDEPWDHRTRSVYDQIKRFASPAAREPNTLAQAVLAAFPDRVGRRRSGDTILLSNGTSAKMANPPGEFLVALDIDAPLIRLAAAIEPEWLLDKAVERTTLEWNRQAERVESVTSLLYDQLTVEETRAPARDDEAAAKFLAAKVVEAGLDRFVDRAELDAFRARVAFAGGPPARRTRDRKRP